MHSNGDCHLEAALHHLDSKIEVFVLLCIAMICISNLFSYSMKKNYSNQAKKKNRQIENLEKKVIDGGHSQFCLFAPRFCTSFSCIKI